MTYRKLSNRAAVALCSRDAVSVRPMYRIFRGIKCTQISSFLGAFVRFELSSLLLTHSLMLLIQPRKIVTKQLIRHWLKNSCRHYASDEMVSTVDWTCTFSLTQQFPLMNLPTCVHHSNRWPVECAVHTVNCLTLWVDDNSNRTAHKIGWWNLFSPVNRRTIAGFHSMRHRNRHRYTEEKWKWKPDEKRIRIKAEKNMHTKQ